MFSLNQKGVVPALVLIAGLGLLVFVLLSSSAPFKDKLFAQLFPKPASYAASDPLPIPTPTPTPILTGNLLSNPGFETGSVSPWIGWQANASLSSIARSGGYGGKAAFTIGTYGNVYTIGQDPVVKNATAGQNYYATAWVRGEGSSIGKTIQVTIRERGSTQTWEISSDAGVKLSSSWQQISVNRTMAESGSILDVYIGQTSAVAGDYFYIDDSSFSITTSTSTPLPIPTPTPTPDTISPTVSITNPQNGATVRKNRKVLITAKAADNVKVSKVEFYIAGSLKCLVLTPNSSDQYSCSWNVPKQPKATYSITAKAYDPSGNTANQAINVTAR